MDNWIKSRYFRSFIDRIPHRFFAKDRDFRYLYANENFAADFGLTPAQIRGKTDFDLFPKASARKIREDDTMVIGQGIDFDRVEESRHTDLQTIIRIIKRPLKNSAGDIIGLMGIFWEIEEESKNKAALEESKRRLRMTLEATGIGISHYDVMKKRMFWDEQCSRIFNVSGRNEGDFQDFLNHVVPEDRESILKAFKQSLINTRSYQDEFRITLPDGSLRYIHVRGEWTAEEDGRPLQITYINFDITNRRRTEDALKSLLELNRSFNESSLDDILHQGLEESIRLTSSQTGFFHIVDEETGQIQFKTWSRKTMELCDIPDVPTHYPLSQAGLWADCIRERKPIVHNDYASAPGKKNLPKGHFPLIRELVVPLFQDDRTVAVIGVGNKPRDYDQFDIDQLSLLGENILNISAKKRAAQKLAEAHEKAVADNEVKDRFFSILAHDLTNPISNIRILVEQIAFITESETPDLPMIREITQILEDSVTTALNLLTDLLTWNRSLRNAIKFSPDFIDPVEPAEQAVMTCSPAAAVKGIVIEKDWERGAITFADMNMMQTVLRNLVTNAVKFTPRGGRISVGVRSEKEQAIYTVRDNGIGIPEERRIKLFTLGETRSTKGTESEKGTGLGLVLCKEFVDKHGGKISVESGIGEGTVISISIPSAKASD